MRIEVIKVNRRVLLNLINFGYKDMVIRYDYLKGIVMDDVDVKREFFVYLIFGISEYVRIKTEIIFKIG